MNSHTHQLPHQQPNGAPMSQPPYYGAQLPMRPQAPYSPPPRQNNGQGYMPPTPRGGRVGRGTNHNYNRMSLPNGRIPPVQTQFGPYDYPVAPMSAMPYQHPQISLEQSQTLPVMRQQIEYYFSVENLCKDLYLRSHMDSQGFVPLLFICGFTRVRYLSQDMNLIRTACEESLLLEYVVGDDEQERLRCRDGWEPWVKAMADRDERSQNDGPKHFQTRSRWFWQSQYNGMPPPSYPMTSSNSFSGYAEPFQPQHYMDPQQSFVPNGTHAHVNGGGSQLSANVPDFSPSGSFSFGGKGAPADSEQTQAAHHSAALAALNGDGKALTNGTNGVHAEEHTAES